MTVINTNVGALQARTYAVKADGNVTGQWKRLSSRVEINSAADDAAGLAVANKMESQIRGMNIAIKFLKMVFPWFRLLSLQWAKLTTWLFVCVNLPFK